MSLREKLTQRMDEIQAKMEANYHLMGEDACIELYHMLDSVQFAWHMLSEEDQDYIHGVQYAIDEQLEWRLP